MVADRTDLGGELVVAGGGDMDVGELGMRTDWTANSIAQSLDIRDPLAWLERENEPLARRLRSTMETSIYLVRAEDDAEPNGGETHLGGSLHLPAGETWPRFRGRPMTFLLQVDLPAAATLRRTDLPSTGRLSFFADTRHSYDAEAPGSWYVAYSPEGVPVAPAPPPDDLEDILRAPHTRPHLVAGRSFEQIWDDELDELCPGSEFDDEDDPGFPAETYFDWLRAVRQRIGGREIHQLLGHPDQAGAAYDLRTSASSAFPGTEARDWRLLLQMDNMHDRLPARFPTGGSAWMWGDGGKLQFWVLREDLAAARFDRVFMRTLSG